MLISVFWKGLPSKIDAVYENSEGKFVFFKGEASFTLQHHSSLPSSCSSSPFLSRGEPFSESFDPKLRHKYCVCVMLVYEISLVCHLATASFTSRSVYMGVLCSFSFVLSSYTPFFRYSARIFYERLHLQEERRFYPLSQIATRFYCKSGED